MLYNVDVTCSRYLLRPEVLRAAQFAALAHEGQVCPAWILMLKMQYTSNT